MEAVEVRFGRGDKRRTLGWLVGDRYVTPKEGEVIGMNGKFLMRRGGVLFYSQDGLNWQ